MLYPSKVLINKPGTNLFILSQYALSYNTKILLHNLLCLYSNFRISNKSTQTEPGLGTILLVNLTLSKQGPGKQLILLIQAVWPDLL